MNQLYFCTECQGSFESKAAIDADSEAKFLTTGLLRKTKAINDRTKCRHQSCKRINEVIREKSKPMQL